MEKLIADCAERIVTLLTKLGDANILRLSEHLAERNVVTYQALGWLARERKISYQQRGSQVYVTLSDDAQRDTDNPTRSSATR